MKYNIDVHLAKTSKIDTVDFSNLPFGKVFSDHMFVADYIHGEWTNLQIIPFQNFSLHPANLALHYGQSIFEGMKATKTVDGTPVLLRPEMHSHRMNSSAKRLCMPEIPQDLFLQAIHELVGIDSEWIPTSPGSALYIRPYMFATGEFIGVQASDTYKFVIFTCPVGPYYSKPVHLWVEEKYVRAVDGGVGEAKCAGNYAASLYPAKLAKEKGYDQVMWMDAHEFKYIQEAGTMNFMFVIDGKVITPATDGSILKGITRDTILKILDYKGIPHEERKVSIDELVAAYHNGTLQEAFGVGTAAVVISVEDITYRELVMKIPPMNIGKMLKEEIENLRTGKVEDKMGWLVPVQTVPANA